MYNKLVTRATFSFHRSLIYKSLLRAGIYTVLSTLLLSSCAQPQEQAQRIIVKRSNYRATRGGNSGEET